MNQQFSNLNQNNLNAQQPIENNDGNNQNSINKPPKKNLSLIIGIAIVGIIVIVIAIYLMINNGSTGNNNNDNNGSNNNSYNIEETDLNGNIKLIKKYNDDTDGELVKFLGTHFAVIKNRFEEDETVNILDKKGNAILTTKYDSVASTNYLGENYFSLQNYDNEITIKKDGKDILKYNSGGSDYYYYYKNNILYYSYKKDNSSFSEAYDLNTKKTLWKVNGKSPFLLDNGYVVISKYNGENDNIINAKTGEPLIKDIKDGEKILVSQGAYYKIKDNDYIESYDFNNNMLSHTAIKNTDLIRYSTQILSNGGYIINEFNNSDWSRTYKIYDKTGKMLITGSGTVNTIDLYLKYYNNSLLEKSSTAEYSLICKDRTEKRDFIVYADGTIIELYDSNICSTKTKKVYVTGYAEDGEVLNENRKVRVVNLNTKESVILDEKVDNDGVISSSPNNNYFILNANLYSDKEYYLYNDKFEKIYESEKILKVVNDEWFIEWGGNTISMISTKTKENKTLEVEGKYDFNNTTNLVTYSLDGKNKWLYSFE